MLSCASLLGTFDCLKFNQSISFSWTFLFPHMFVGFLFSCGDRNNGWSGGYQRDTHFRISFFPDFCPLILLSICNSVASLKLDIFVLMQQLVHNDKF
jgi:hypothetical protein